MASRRCYDWICAGPGLHAAQCRSGILDYIAKHQLICVMKIRGTLEILQEAVEIRWRARKSGAGRGIQLVAEKTTEIGKLLVILVVNDLARGRRPRVFLRPHSIFVLQKHNDLAIPGDNLSQAAGKWIRFRSLGFLCWTLPGNWRRLASAGSRPA